VFLDNHTLTFRCSKPMWGGRHHKDHPPGPLRIVEPWSEAAPSWAHGWESQSGAWSKTILNGLSLERSGPDRVDPSRRRTIYELRRGHEHFDLFEAHWADFDQRGRLVATVGGRVFEAKVKTKIQWRELADFSREKPERMEAPGWAQRW